MKKMKHKKAKTEEPESYNIFKCDVCAGSKEMELAEFKDYLLKVHEIKPDQMKGVKQMIMHMDGTNWFSSTYAWTLQSGVKFHQFIQMARAKNDPMRNL